MCKVTAKAEVVLGLESTDNSSCSYSPHYSAQGAFPPSLVPAPGQETDGPDAAGIKAGVVKGQSSAACLWCDQGKSPDLCRPQVLQCNLRIIAPIS